MADARTWFLVLGVLSLLWFVYALFIAQQLLLGILPGVLVGMGYIFWRVLA